MISKSVFATVLAGSFVLALPTLARRGSEDVIRIELGGDSSTESDISKRDLERRIYRLERAVRQLQDRVFELESKETVEAKDKTYTCYIETQFHGTISVDGKSETKARTEVLKECHAKAKELKCKSEFVKCGA